MPPEIKRLPSHSKDSTDRSLEPGITLRKLVFLTQDDSANSRNSLT